MKKLFNTIKMFVLCHFFPKKIKTQGMVGDFEMSFECLNTRFYDWYAVIPYWLGSKEQLAMVGGSEDMLTIMADGHKYLTLSISLANHNDKSIKLEKIHETSMGATYQVHNYNRYDKTVWLCNVSRFVFGYHPEKIYINKIELK